MELGHLPYKKSTYEDYVGERGLDRRGKGKWRRHVEDVVARLIAALEPDDVVLGGGNVKLLKRLPAGCRAGDNANAFIGGFRLWEGAGVPRKPIPFPTIRQLDKKRRHHGHSKSGNSSGGWDRSPAYRTAGMEESAGSASRRSVSFISGSYSLY